MSEYTTPVLHEHEPIKDVSSTSPTGYTPSDEEKKLIKRITDLFSKAKKFRKQYDTKWLDYYKMFRGKQWKENRPSYRHSEVINMVFQNIQSMVPILTDSRPRIEYLPENPADTEVAKLLSEVAESDWQSGNWLYRLTEMLYDGHFYGTGIGYMGYDPKAKLGEGAIEFKSKDPFYCFPDPNAKDVNEDADHFIEAEPFPLEKLKKEYPDKAKFIKPDLEDLIAGNKTNIDQYRYKSPVDNNTIVEGSSAYDIDKPDMAIKITCWFKDDAFEENEEDEKDAEGNPVKDPVSGLPKKVYVQKLSYPNGRKVCMAGGVILDDVPAPFEDGKFPFARYSNYIVPREFWGISEVEQLESPQKIFNKLVSFALDIYTLMGNPIWVVDNNSGVDTDNLFNRPGLVVEKEPDTEVRREAGLDINPSLFQMIDRMRSWFNDISGSNDVSRGIQPQGITAGIAITSLQEAAQTRLRQKSRNIDCCVQTLGQMYKSRAFQFYDAPRIFRVTQDETSAKYFKMHIEKHTDELGNEKRVVSVRGFTQTPDGQTVPEPDAKMYQIQGEFDVKVSTGSALPFAKEERVNKALALFDRKIIDEEEVLKAMDYPNWEAVIQRMNEKNAMAQQQEMAMQQQDLAAKMASKASPPQGPSGAQAAPMGAPPSGPL